MKEVISQQFKLEDLFVYKISLELCDLSWKIYEPLDWRTKKTMGDQFIRSVDSNAANIAEGYGRYHYLDRIRFYYNARASLVESVHWAKLMYKRNIITKTQFDPFVYLNEHVHYHLNQWINMTYKTRDKNQSKKT